MPFSSVRGYIKNLSGFEVRVFHRVGGYDAISQTRISGLLSPELPVLDVPKPELVNFTLSIVTTPVLVCSLANVILSWFFFNIQHLGGLTAGKLFRKQSRLTDT